MTLCLSLPATAHYGFRHPYHSFSLGLQYTKALYKHYPFVLMMKLFIPKYVYPYINLKKDSDSRKKCQIEDEET